MLLKQNGKFESVPSCCVPLEILENAEILTSKVFADNKSGEELIDAFSKNFASQCGFCTAGFAISMSKKTEESGSKILDGNFCRCTGYRPILQVRNSEITDEFFWFKKSNHPEIFGIFDLKFFGFFRLVGSIAA